MYKKHKEICGNCEALYCMKCAETLTDLENACRACNTPFDETRPSKPFMEGNFEDKIKISDESQKKTNNVRS